MKTLSVVFSRRGDLEAQLAHLKRGTCFVPAPDPEPEALASVELAFVARDQSVTQGARVLQVISGAGVALECSDAEALRAFIERAAPALGAEGPALRVQWGVVEDDESEAGIHERIRGMAMNEKLQLALHGDKLARTILLKDPNKTIQAYIIKNRRITLDEVKYIAGFRQASPDVLKMIGESREWTQSPGIVSALVANPKTPSLVAIKLLKVLPLTEVRRIAKSPSTPQAVSSAAKRMVIEK